MFIGLKLGRILLYFFKPFFKTFLLSGLLDVFFTSIPWPPRSFILSWRSSIYSDHKMSPSAVLGSNLPTKPRPSTGVSNFLWIQRGN